jgi:hypothetical protein
MIIGTEEGYGIVYAPNTKSFLEPKKRQGVFIKSSFYIRQKDAEDFWEKAKDLYPKSDSYMVHATISWRSG